jgi:hypothetical protein
MGHPDNAKQPDVPTATASTTTSAAATRTATATATVAEQLQRASVPLDTYSKRRVQLSDHAIIQPRTPPTDAGDANTTIGSVLRCATPSGLAESPTARTLYTPWDNAWQPSGLTTPANHSLTFESARRLLRMPGSNPASLDTLGLTPTALQLAKTINIDEVVSPAPDLAASC